MQRGSCEPAGGSHHPAPTMLLRVAGSYWKLEPQLTTAKSWQKINLHEGEVIGSTKGEFGPKNQKKERDLKESMF